jgi:predicted ATPase
MSYTLPFGCQRWLSAASSVEGPLAKYNAGLARGIYRHDERQQDAINILDDLHKRILTLPPIQSDSSSNRSSSSNGNGGGFFKSFFSSSSSSSAAPSQSVPSLVGGISSVGTKGLYLHGGVGSGKVRE